MRQMLVTLVAVVPLLSAQAEENIHALHHRARHARTGLLRVKAVDAGG